MNLRQVFDRFREYGLRFKPRKCELFRQRVQFLGRTISADGVEMGDQYISAIKDWKVPQNTKDTQRFLGFANYHRQFIAISSCYNCHKCDSCFIVIEMPFT